MKIGYLTRYVENNLFKNIIIAPPGIFSKNFKGMKTSNIDKNIVIAMVPKIRTGRKYNLVPDLISLSTDSPIEAS